MYNFYKYIIFFLLLYHSFLRAEFIIPIPNKKIYPVNDFAGVLNKKDIYLLNNKLIEFNKKNSIEILINIVNNLNGEDPAIVAANWGYLWKIGNKKESNGIIILLSIQDRKISIQTGYGIEPYLTDIKSKIIIDNIIKPNINKGYYYLAIDKSIKAIFNIVDNIYLKKKIVNKNNNKINFLIYILLFIIFLIFYIRKYKQNNNINIEYDPFIIDDHSIYNNKNEDDFEGFGGGGNFGGGGASGNW